MRGLVVMRGWRFISMLEADMIGRNLRRARLGFMIPATAPGSYRLNSSIGR